MNENETHLADDACGSLQKETAMTANRITAATSPHALAEKSTAGRVVWVDYAKGICIVMVVMMHSVLGVEAAAGQTGFMHLLVAFAKPFRMPDFFLISGLFLAVVIDRDWRTYLDRKVAYLLSCNPECTGQNAD